MNNISEKEERTNKIFIVAGIIILLFFIFDLTIKSQTDGPYYVLWFCVLSVLLLSIAYIFRNSTLILAILPITIFSIALWYVDYFMMAFYLQPMTYHVDYMFAKNETLLQFIIGLKHLFIIPLALIGLKYMKIPRKYLSWFIAMFIGLLIVVISPMIPVYNLNCATSSCWTNSGAGNWTLGYSIGLYLLAFVFSLAIYVPLFLLVKKAHEDNEDKNKKNIYMKILNWLIIVFLIIGFIGVIAGSIKYFLMMF